MLDNVAEKQYSFAMANLVPTREELGGDFTEGARLLWQVMLGRGWSQARLAREIGASPSAVNRWLYGDQVPLFKWLLRIQQKFRISMAKWSEVPTESFRPPAAAA